MYCFFYVGGRKIIVNIRGLGLRDFVLFILFFFFGCGGGCWGLEMFFFSFIIGSLVFFIGGWGGGRGE